MRHENDFYLYNCISRVCQTIQIVRYSLYSSHRYNCTIMLHMMLRIDLVCRIIREERFLNLLFSQDPNVLQNRYSHNLTRNSQVLNIIIVTELKDLYYEILCRYASIFGILTFSKYAQNRKDIQSKSKGYVIIQES